MRFNTVIVQSNPHEIESIAARVQQMTRKNKYLKKNFYPSNNWKFHFATDAMHQP